MRVFPSILFATAFCLRASAVSLEGRFNGECTLLGRKIYYLGGAVAGGDISQATPSNALYYLDILNSFSVSQASTQWQAAPNMGGSSAEQAYNFAMVVLPGESAIMVYGGEGGNRDMESPAMMYYAKDEVWREYPNPLPSLKQMAMGTLSRGDGNKAYFFGGRSVITVDPVFPPFDRLMHIYDVSAGSWSDGAALPEGFGVRFGAARTLTGGGKEIVYIGGMTATYDATAITRDNIPVPFTDILIYNTVENTWRQENATGNVPSPRISHTVAAKPNSRQIIMYGGQTNQTSGAIQGNYCYVLNTDSWTWEKKNPIGVGPGPLYGHSTVFPDGSSLLFVLFGVNSTGLASESFGVLNTETWSWSSNYQSSYSGSDIPEEEPDDGLSTGALAGIVVGCVVGVGIIVGVLVFLCIRKRRNKKQQILLSEQPSGSKTETRVLQPMSPLLDRASSYRSQSDDKEHLYSDRPASDQSSTPNYVFAKSDMPIFLQTAKPDGSNSEYGGSSTSGFAMASEKPDGASTIPKSDKVRPMKPDGV
ncbi:hypothetical protein BJV82DRAFT_607552 [Fennellomyces sp. T-0311]|nr:hypothetical protein BJV82DRAFT_607552 [Fennellomyces sp. T-0311]